MQFVQELDFFEGGSPPPLDRTLYILSIQEYAHIHARIYLIIQELMSMGWGHGLCMDFNFLIKRIEMDECIHVGQ